MLIFLFAIPPLFLQVVAAIQNVTIQLSDPSLSFAPGWRLSQSQESGNFLFTDSIISVPALTVSLPSFVSRLSYIGLKRTRGSIYGVCVDCSGTPTVAFSGHDNQLASNALAVPTIIFTLDLDPSRQHVLKITNIPDPSFNDASELTFIAIVVSVEDATTSSSTTPPSSSPVTLSATITSLSSQTTFSIASSSLTTTTQASATASADSDSTTKSSIIAVVVLLPLIALLSLLIGLFFFWRNRGRRKWSSLAVKRSRPTVRLSSPRLASSEVLLGPLATAGRARPPARLPEPFPFEHDTALHGSVAFSPVRRPPSR